MKPRASHSKVETMPTELAVSTPHEKKQVAERVAIGANVVYEAIRREGEDELSRTPSALAWSGFAAGLSMGFSFVAEALLRVHLPHSPWAPLITKLGYSVGFLIVVLGRQQLFTENTLTVILPLLARKETGILLRRVLRLWGIVLTANLAGTFLFALCLARIVVFDAETQAAFAQIGAEHFGTGFAIAALRGILQAGSLR